MTIVMTEPNYAKTRRACYFSYLSMSSVFTLPPLLFETFHTAYGVSYSLLGTLVLVNFLTQLTIDLIFTFFTRLFNIEKTLRIMPLLTAFGLGLYALSPTLFPSHVYVGLVIGTVIFSVSAGLSEVLISPTVAAIPSEHPDRDMSMLHSLYGWGVVSVAAVSSLYFLLFGTENWTYLAFFLACFPVIASVLFFVSPIPEMDLTSSDAKNAAGRSTGLLLCVLCIFLGSSAENAMTNWISCYVESALLLPKAVGDVLGMAVFALLLASCRVFYAKRGKNIMKTLLLSMIGATVCYLVAGAIPSILISFLACVLTGFCTAMLWPGTLILMEEKIPSPGVAAYALMAAGGDFGASVAPQLLGILVDKISVSGFAARLGETAGLLPDQVGLRCGVLIAAVFPLLGICVILVMRRYFRKTEK